MIGTHVIARFGNGNAQCLELGQLISTLLKLAHHFVVLRTLPQPLEVVVDGAGYVVLDTS